MTGPAAEPTLKTTTAKKRKLELETSVPITAIALIAICLSHSPACKKSAEDRSPEPAETGNLHSESKADLKTGSTAVEAGRLVAKAIDAAGGKTALKKNLSTYTTRSRGERHNEAFESLISWKSPDTMLMVLNSGEQRFLLKKDRCVIQDKGVTFECTSSRRKELFQTAWMTHLAHLYPLVDGSVVLQTGPDTVLKTPDGSDSKKVFSIIASPKINSSGQSFDSQAESKTDYQPSKKAPVILYFDKQSYRLAGIAQHEEPQPQTLTLFGFHRETGGIMVPEKRLLVRGSATIVTERTAETEFGVFHDDEADKAVATRWEESETCNLPAKTYALSKHMNHYESFHEVVEHFAKRMHSDGLVMTGPAEVAVLTRFRDIKNIRKIPLEIRIPSGKARDSKKSPGGIVTKFLKERRGLCMPTRGTMAQALDRLSRLKVQAKRKFGKISDPMIRIFPAQDMKEGHGIYELIVTFR